MDQLDRGAIFPKSAVAVLCLQLNEFEFEFRGVSYFILDIAF